MTTAPPRPWTRSETLAIADCDCTQCHGLGLEHGKLGSIEPCNCVLQAVFRAVFDRFQVCTAKEKSLSRVTLDPQGPAGRATWGRKDEEFVADVLLIARRTLNRAEMRLWRLHYVLGADWRLCCQRLDVGRAAFLSAAYRVEQKLGRAFRDEAL